MPNKIFEAIFHDFPDTIKECQEMIKSYQYPQAQTSLTYIPANNNNVSSETSPESQQIHPSNNVNNNNTRSSLAKQRQAVGSGFSTSHPSSPDLDCQDSPLHVVKRRFKELIFEQEIPGNQTVQLMHNCLTGVANDYFIRASET